MVIMLFDGYLLGNNHDRISQAASVEIERILAEEPGNSIPSSLVVRNYEIPNKCFLCFCCRSPLEHHVIHGN